MKRVFLLLAILALTGCGNSQIISRDEGSKMVCVASCPLAKIYTVTIDGKDYVVVLGAYKAAITPKVNKTKN